MKIQSFQLYEDRSDIRLDAYIADDSEEILKGQMRPAVIVVPGGAYVVRSDREAEPIACNFLAMGYHAFILHYSVLSRRDGVWPSDMDPNREADPEVVHPAPVLELGMAMQLIRGHAEEWHVDTEQIGIIGFSAGGHVCAMYSDLYCKPVLTEALHTTPDALRPAFCVLGYPFIDYVYHTKLHFEEPSVRTAYELMYLSYFGTRTPSEEQQIEGSANYHVTEQNPPTFIWNCSTDAGVPVQHTLHMAEALAEKNVPFELHSFGEGQHGLAMATAATAGGAHEVNDTVAAWFPLLATWLKKYVKFPQI